MFEPIVSAKLKANSCSYIDLFAERDEGSETEEHEEKGTEHRACSRAEQGDLLPIRWLQFPERMPSQHSRHIVANIRALHISSHSSNFAGRARAV